MRLAALGLALLTVAILAADPIACPDGCTAGNPFSQAASAACAFCQRGVSLETGVSLPPPIATVRRIYPPRAACASSLVVRSIDHPPRPAQVVSRT
ncbi:MAG TPA: hypothetical protein VNK92_07555 [Vicinamibacterales bacterium]|nr:hypothetical protein [Vicinamibacterales bacterium]